jgi:hypothetical protein
VRVAQTWRPNSSRTQNAERTFCHETRTGLWPLLFLHAPSSSVHTLPVAACSPANCCCNCPCLTLALLPCATCCIWCLQEK